MNLAAGSSFSSTSLFLRIKYLLLFCVSAVAVLHSQRKALDSV